MLKQVKKFVLYVPIVLFFGLFCCLTSCQGWHDVKRIDLDQDILWYLNCISNDLEGEKINCRKIFSYIDKVEKKIAYYCGEIHYRPSYTVQDALGECVKKVEGTIEKQANSQNLLSISQKITQLHKDICSSIGS